MPPENAQANQDFWLYSGLLAGPQEIVAAAVCGVTSRLKHNITQDKSFPGSWLIRDTKVTFRQHKTPKVIHKMKTLVAIIALCCVSLSSIAGTYLTISAKGNYGGDATDGVLIETGKVARVVFANLEGSSTLRITVNSNAALLYSSTDVKNTPNLPIIVGPAYVSVFVQSGVTWSAICTVEISSGAEVCAPSTAVVIPSDSAGPVNIKLESSCDLMNWNACLPGMYGTTSTNRFFRVRAERTN